VTLYVDSSALLKLYVEEADTPIAETLIQADPVLVTSWITVVEVRRNICRHLRGTERQAVLEAFERDLDEVALIGAGELVCRAAARISEVLGVRSLDAIHLGAAQSLQIPAMPFLTFDLRQAQAARSLGFAVLGS
jgi:uncharacterized protein